jgi:hypothetical protein
MVNWKNYMTIYYINTGSNPNAGDGDSLRVAFTKVNLNFNTLADQIDGITTGTVDWLNVPSSIIPDANLAYDLGSTSSQWRSLYVGTSTIYIGGVPLSIIDNTLVVGSDQSSTATSLATESFVINQINENNVENLEIDGGNASTNYTAEIEIDGGGA